MLGESLASCNINLKVSLMSCDQALLKFVPSIRNEMTYDFFFLFGHVCDQHRGFNTVPSCHALWLDFIVTLTYLVWAKEEITGGKLSCC